MSLKAGDAAPNFDIVDTNGNKLTLADLGTQKAWLTLYRPVSQSAASNNFRMNEIKCGGHLRSATPTPNYRAKML